MNGVRRHGLSNSLPGYKPPWFPHFYYLCKLHTFVHYLFDEKNDLKQVSNNNNKKSSHSVDFDNVS